MVYDPNMSDVGSYEDVTGTERKRALDRKSSRADVQDEISIEIYRKIKQYLNNLTNIYGRVTDS